MTDRIRPARDSFRGRGHVLAVLVALAVGCGSTSAQSGPPITFEQVLGEAPAPDFRGRRLRASWRDGRIVASRGGRDQAFDLTTRTWGPVPEGTASSGADRQLFLDALDIVPDFDWSRSEVLRATVGGLSADGTAVDGARPHIRNGRRVAFSDGRTVQSFSMPSEWKVATVDPSGRRIAYVDGFDLWIHDLSSGARTRLTTDGSADGYRSGLLDWVYQEEVYGRGRWRAHWWSERGRQLAFLRLDESRVPIFPIADPRKVETTIEEMRYPKAGAPNPDAELWVFDVATGASRRIDLSRAPCGDEPIIARVTWSPSGELFVQVQDRVQTKLSLLRAERGAEVAKPLFTIGDPEGWVDVAEEPRFLADGSFLWVSATADSPIGIRRYDRNGRRLGDLSLGCGEVLGIDRVGALPESDRIHVWFRATGPDATQSHLFRCALDGEPERLTFDDGSHRTMLGPDGDFLDVWSSYDRPAQLRWVREDGREVIVLDTALPKDLDRYQTPVAFRPAAAEVPGVPSTTLDAHVVMPEIEAGRRVPVWLSIYGGPGSPSVRDAWRPNLFHQFLASRGVATVVMDNRTATRRGHAVRRLCARELGVLEIADFVAGLDDLAEELPLDLDRVAIDGWSYGGFLAAYALATTDRFALGCAGAGVHDWRNYDSIYTERYMSTPTRNPGGYARTSVVANAANLSGHLLLAHGLADDNVHFNNTVQLVDALQAAGKDYDVRFYPGATHGLRGRQRRDWRRAQWDAIQEHLLEVDVAAEGTR